MKRLFLLYASTLVVGMLGALRVASADISLADFCASQSGNFSDSTCTLLSGGAISADTLILFIGEALIIPAGTTLTVNGTGAISVDGEIQNDGTVDVASTGMIYLSDGRIVNTGTINNSYLLHTDEGPLVNSGTINNFYRLIVADTTVSNSGAINNSYSFAIGEPAFLSVDTGGVVDNTGTFDIDGTVLIDENGRVNNQGLGTMDLGPEAQLSILDDGALINRGTIAIVADGTIDNEAVGLFDNSVGTVTNYGRIRDRCGTFIGTIPTSGLAIIDLCPADERIEAIVDDWAEDGTISGGQRNSLRSKLMQILIHIERGQTASACNQLDALINEVRAMMRAGKVSSPEADDLIAAANELKSDLGCPA